MKTHMCCSHYVFFSINKLNTLIETITLCGYFIRYAIHITHPLHIVYTHFYLHIRLTLSFSIYEYKYKTNECETKVEKYEKRPTNIITLRKQGMYCTNIHKNVFIIVLVLGIKTTQRRNERILLLKIKTAQMPNTCLSRKYQTRHMNGNYVQQISLKMLNWKKSTY